MKYSAKLHIWESVENTAVPGPFGISRSGVTGKAWKGLLLLPPNVRVEIDGTDPEDVRHRALVAAKRMLGGPDEADITKGTHTEIEIEFTT